MGVEGLRSGFLLVVVCGVCGFSAVSREAGAKSVSQSEEFGDTSRFVSTVKAESLQILRQLRGSGKFSDVYVATDRRDKQQVVVKTLKQHPHYARMIAREISILDKLRDVPDIIRLKDLHRNSSTGAVSLVFPYLGDGASGFLHARDDPLSVGELKAYFHRMLTALSRCHAAGVVHRDIKPKNVLINRKAKELHLIDFGMSEFYPPDKPMSCKVATRPYKAPELLLGNREYTPAVDVWASGLILAGLIFRKMPFIRGETNPEQLTQVSKLVGSQPLRDYCAKYGLQLSEELDDVIGAEHPATPLTAFKSPKNEKWATDDAIELCEQMLTVDHELRPTCQECLAHRYFGNVR